MSHRGFADDRHSANLLAAALQHFEQRRFSEAAPLFQQVLRAQPDHALSLYRLGMIARYVGMPDRAIRLLREALRVGGQSPDLLNDLGSLYVDAGDVASATCCFQRCIEQYPRSALGYISLAYLKNLEGQFAAAESLYQTAVRQSTEPFEAEFNLATLYREWGQLEKAVELYDALLAEHPTLALLADGRARALLQLRKWREGWEAYEARFALEDEPVRMNLDLAIPRWRGESLSDKHLLVLCEQGIGDEIQFASCYADAITRAGRCTITCSPRLQPVLARSFPQATWIPVAERQRESWRPNPSLEFDCFTPAGSLPRYFRNHDCEFPGSAYIAGSVNADARPDRRRNRLRVGVSWWGGALADQMHKRSVPLEVFQELLHVVDVEFVNLQHGCGEKTKIELSRFPNLQTAPIDPYQELEPWFELLASLDLVISVDNSNVHFAGSLGVPTWLLLGDHPNWRWPYERDASPWYASVEFVRKTPSGDWAGTIKQVCQRLTRLAHDHGSLSAA